MAERAPSVRAGAAWPGPGSEASACSAVRSVRAGALLRTGLLAALLAGCGGARGPAPIADRPIDLVGRCTQTEEDGFREDARLRVRDNRVEELEWHIRVGIRGECRFSLEGFRQVRSRPSIELAALDGSRCRLMVWQEPRRVTLAHHGCEARCTAGIYEEAWPVMFEPVTGGCATP